MGDKAAAAAKSEIMKGDKLGRQRAHNGDHEGKQMKGDKAAAQNRDHKGKQIKGDNKGRQGGSGSQEQPRMEIRKGDNKGRQGGSGITTIWRLWGSTTPSLRSKNP